MLKSKTIKDAVRRGDTDFFYEMYRNDDEDTEQYQKEFEVASDLNFGDGRERFLTLKFPRFDCYVTLKGYHSSYSKPEWTKVYFSEPYEHTETRYREHYDTLE
jgi:hypothetical protein